MLQAVIHAVGPRFDHFETAHEANLQVLKNAYKNSMECTRENQLKSVGFCILSAGIVCGLCPLSVVIKTPGVGRHRQARLLRPRDGGLLRLYASRADEDPQSCRAGSLGRLPVTRASCTGRPCVCACVCVCERAGRETGESRTGLTLILEVSLCPL